MASVVQIKDKEFQIIQKLLFKETGISLGDNKKTMVQSRLEKRLRHHNINCYSDYLKIVQISHVEKVEFLNELTTNETYFFREMKHFEFLSALADKSKSLRVWSAAASMGAEAYSIAMLLDDKIANRQWEVVGTDINTQTLDIAKMGLYQFSWIKKIPTKFQQKYCLKGSNTYKDKMLIDRELIKNVHFYENNLLKENLGLGEFDVIFLRNVLLYFTEETKLKVIENVMKILKSGGYLIISMTEHFEDAKIENIKYLQNAIYQKV
jgi:chemotaxis protein methyltransferase CheR